MDIRNIQRGEDQYPPPKTEERYSTSEVKQLPINSPTSHPIPPHPTPLQLLPISCLLRRVEAACTLRRLFVVSCLVHSVLIRVGSNNMQLVFYFHYVQRILLADRWYSAEVPTWKYRYIFGFQS